MNKEQLSKILNTVKDYTDDLMQDLDNRIDELPTNEYNLPVASANTLGGIKVGKGLSVDPNGVLNANAEMTNNESLASYIEPVYGNNLITADNRVTSFVDKDGKTINGKFTNYIPMKKGTHYVSNLAYTQYYFFNEEKNHISSRTCIENPQVFSPTSDGYLLIKINDASNPIVLKGTDIDAYRSDDVKIQREKMQNTSKWYGKNWLCIGDSISTDNQNLATVGYAKLISEELCMTLTNVALCGKTMSYFYNLIDDYPNDYDLITVMLGTNNQGYNCAIGEINDDFYKQGTFDSNKSFIAQAQLMYEKLRTKYPKSVIMFLTPIKRTATDQGTNNEMGYCINAYGLTTEAYRDAIKKVCDWYSIPCVDLYNSIDPRTHINRATYFMNELDGIHPNNLGHALFVAPIVRDAVIKHEPYYFNDWGNTVPNPDTPDEPETNVFGNIVVSSSNIRVNEGESVSFTVQLDKAPTNPQQVTLNVTNGDMTLDKSNLTFTNENYNVPQTIVVSTLDNENVGDVNATVSISSKNVASKTVTISIIDNDAETPDEPEIPDVPETPTDLKNIEFDFTTLKEGDVSINSIGTEPFTLNMPANTKDGYISVKTDNNKANYQPDNVSFLNNSSFTIISKYMLTNNGIYPNILSTSYANVKQSYNVHIAYSNVTNYLGFAFNQALTNGFYMERYLRVDEYAYGQTPENVSYEVEGVSSKSTTIPFDKDVWHTVAITYNINTNEIKVYVDGVYKDRLDYSVKRAPIQWTGLCIESVPECKYTNLYIDNQCRDDAGTISLMTNIFNA